eukprot:Nitzschia sp. Nitz4//scaffold120_size68122//15173//16414//NITZ4_006038-RA/size68122-snap-gene-0.84-mRNA-1//1//CDS//3329534260//7049//frame0
MVASTEAHAIRRKRSTNLHSSIGVVETSPDTVQYEDATSSTTSDTGDSAGPSHDAETHFHLPAYKTIRRLLNDSTILSWGLKKEKGFEAELRIKYLLSNRLEIERLHGRNDSDKMSSWLNQSNSFYWESRICHAIQVVQEISPEKRHPHVLFTRCNENFGDFSRYVPDRKCASWDGTVDWKQNGCTSDEMVYQYLEQPTTRAVFTTQHHFIDHPKVHSLPLGIKHTMKFPVLKLLREPYIPKSKWLMINDNGWKHRKNVTSAVLENFASANVTLRNTYSNKRSQQYLEELRRSRFILAPSGLGWDCYRIWEALHFRTIPIIERYYRPHDGWRRTLDDLPVLWVEDFRNLTPALLRVEYERITSQVSNYYFEKLIWPWWADFAQKQLQKPD